MAIKFKRGDKFGRLTIVDDAYSFSKADNGGNIRRYWRCICECGNETYVAASFLKNGSIQSCGCLIKDKTIEASRIDEIGNRYGKLTVIEYACTKNKSWCRQISSRTSRKSRLLKRYDIEQSNEFVYILVIIELSQVFMLKNLT